MNNLKKIKSALISVYHKDGLNEIVETLNSLGVKIYSTGGTQSFIESLGVEVAPVEGLTGYPSILGGRVKTLHPKVFGGILARRDNEGDIDQLKEYDIPELDLIIVDLYPFEDTVASGASNQDIIEKIRNLINNYFPAVWTSVIIVAIYLGALMVSKRDIRKWNHKIVQLPYFIVYLLLGILFFCIFPSTRIWGYNGLFMIAPVFLIQGISVLDFYWGNYFRKSKFLLFFLIISMILNYFLLLLVALMGVFDIWFNFRKIYILEESDGNHFNKRY